MSRKSPLDAVQKIDEAERRAEAAKALMTNPVFKEALDTLHAQYLDQFVTSAPAQKDERDEAYWLMRALDKVKRDLEATMAGGAVAAHNLRKALAKLGD